MISIGLPAVKHQFLEEAIGSVLAQDYPAFELIICNDRSDPRIRAIVEGFADPRIRYAEGEGPLEVIPNWNHVLSLARGEYFVLFADDDRYHPGFLSALYRCFLDHPEVAVAHCRVNRIDSRGVNGGMTPLCPAWESGLEFILNRVEGNREQFAPEFMVRTDRLRAIGGFAELPLAWGSDDLTWFRLALAGGIAFHPEPLADWRRSSGQISESGDTGLRMKAVDLYMKELEEIVLTLKPGTEQEKRLLEKIASGLADYRERQKAHLLAVHARQSGWIDHAAFYFRERKSHNLKFSWFAYSVYARLFLPS